MLLRLVRPNWDCIGVGLLVLCFNILVAFSGIVVTAGGNDQASFHMRSVHQALGMLPFVDISALHTATGPLYHVVVAIASWMLSANEVGIQILGSMFSVVLAVYVTYLSRSISTVSLRFLAVSPLVFSAYFWQSSLWMMTDNAAVLFFLLGINLLVTYYPKLARDLVGGLFLGLAIATRQSYAWVLLPVFYVNFVILRRGGSIPHRFLSLASWCLPGVAVLLYLISSWGGLTPSAMRGFNNNGLSPSALSYAYALSLMFFLPILLSVWSSLRSTLSSKIGVSCLVFGVCAALPAAVFESAPTERPNDARRGGLLWTVLSKLPVIEGRSLVLIVLSFAGGVVLTSVGVILQKELGNLVAVSVPALAVSATFGSQLYQKYFELPLAGLAVISIISC